MENENSKKKTTAPDTSVGADDGQPLHNSTENSISAFDEEINGDFQNSTESLDEIYRRIQRLTDPHYLHTISMTELYQTAYQSRPPIIDGLLYAGAYILAGAPKIGKSFVQACKEVHYNREKGIQAAKGSGRGKQADCKAENRNRRFETGAFRVQICSQQAPHIGSGTRKRRASRKSATL